MPAIRREGARGRGMGGRGGGGRSAPDPGGNQRKGGTEGRGVGRGRRRHGRGGRMGFVDIRACW